MIKFKNLKAKLVISINKIVVWWKCYPILRMIPQNQKQNCQIY